MNKTVSALTTVATIVPRLLFSAFGLFFCFVGMQAVEQGRESLRDIEAMQSWESTPCTIVSSSAEDYGEDFKLVLSYTFFAEGHLSSGTRYSYDEFFTAETLGEVEEMVRRYPAGLETRCYFNPDDWSQSVLILPAVTEGKRAAAFGYIFPSVGLLFAAIPWFSFFRKRRKGKPEANAAENEKPNVRKGRLFFILFGGVFLLIGLAILYPASIRPLLKIRDARTWEPAQAVVVSSKVKTHEGDDTDTYSAYIAYRYTFNGREYTGDRYTFADGSSSGYESKAEKVRQHPRGHQMTVYVNPANPSESVVNPKPTWGLLLGLIPLVFCIAGGAVIYAGIRKGRVRPLDPAQARQRVVVLKGKSPVFKAVGVTVFSTLWIGVVVFLFKVQAPLLFRVVFGLFGLLAIWGVIHSILACFNPRPTVEITPGNLQPGMKAALRWRLSGRTDRIRRLQVSLRCLHVTTETRRSGGKSKTSVEYTPIFTESLLDTDEPGRIAQGVLEFRIPEDQAASRRGNHDGIRWQIIYQADIPRWPDVKEPFDFTVYPEDQGLGKRH